MNWRNEAIEKLGKLTHMRTSLEGLPLEINRLAEEIRRLCTQCQQDAAWDKDKENLLLCSLLRHGELCSVYDQAKCWVQFVERGLESLEPTQRQLLEKLFVQPVPARVEQLCRELAVERSSVYRYREKALRSFTLALYPMPHSV